MTSRVENPTALISYSHDSPEHEKRVLELCNRLRARGIDAFVDQFLPGAPSEGWPLWMERQIEGRDFTLMVCTEAYRRRFMGDEAAGVGRGVVWEARILRNLLYENSDWRDRIVPVVIASEDRAFVPTVFREHFYDLSDESEFENLLRHLLREPGAEAGALGLARAKRKPLERFRTALARSRRAAHALLYRPRRSPHASFASSSSSGGGRRSRV